MFLATIGILIAIIVPRLINGVSKFVNNIPLYADWLETALADDGVITISLQNWGLDFDKTELLHQLYAYHDQIALVVLEFLEQTAFSALALTDVASFLLITPLVVFYLLKDWPKFIKSSLELAPKKYQNKIEQTFKSIDIALGAFLRGQGSVCLLLGLFYGVSLEVYGLEMGFLIGLFTGLVSFIPFAGMMLGLVVAFSVAVMQYKFNVYIPYVIIMAIFMVGQILEGFLLTPKLVGDKVGLHPVWVIFAVMAGGEIAGVLGVLIALPAATVLTVVIPMAIKYISTKYDG